MGHYSDPTGEEAIANLGRVVHRTAVLGSCRSCGQAFEITVPVAGDVVDSRLSVRYAGGRRFVVHATHPDQPRPSTAPDVVDCGGIVRLYALTGRAHSTVSKQQRQTRGGGSTLAVWRAPDPALSVPPPTRNIGGMVPIRAGRAR